MKAQTKTQKKANKLIGYMVECKDGHVNTLGEANCSISADTYECGLCSTHGTVNLSIFAKCSTCDEPLVEDIELSSW